MSALPAEEHAPGSLLLGEIREQPAALERLLEHVVMLFLADLDSGRLAVRVARGESQ